MYAETLNNLIEELKKMPGIGPKSAQRLAFYILGSSKADVEKLVEVIKEAKEKIRYCSECFNITDTDPCRICDDLGRDKGLCIVADPKDLIALERSHEFFGKYHVLGGLISPLDGIGPDALRIKELISRINNNSFTEVILALSATAEGEATSIYLSKILKPLGVPLSRLAYGLPVGADMDYADEATLSRALEGRSFVK